MLVISYSCFFQNIYFYWFQCVALSYWAFISTPWMMRKPSVIVTYGTMVWRISLLRYCMGKAWIVHWGSVLMSSIYEFILDMFVRMKSVYPQTQLISCEVFSYVLICFHHCWMTRHIPGLAEGRETLSFCSPPYLSFPSPTQPFFPKPKPCLLCSSTTGGFALQFPIPSSSPHQRVQHCSYLSICSIITRGVCLEPVL